MKTEQCQMSGDYSPENALVEVLDVDVVEVVQVVDALVQVLLELVPRDVDDLVGDVALDHLHKVLHLVSVENTGRQGRDGSNTERVGYNRGHNTQIVD